MRYDVYDNEVTSLRDKSGTCVQGSAGGLVMACVPRLLCAILGHQPLRESIRTLPLFVHKGNTLFRR